MILLCDEDIGSGVPHALSDVGYETVSISQRGWIGMQDVDWLSTAGQRGWLVFSANKKMLLVPDERATIINHNVGAVFLTNGEERIVRVLQLLLRRWDILDLLDRTEPRPFVRFLNMRGQLLRQYRNLSLSI